MKGIISIAISDHLLVYKTAFPAQHEIIPNKYNQILDNNLSSLLLLLIKWDDNVKFLIMNES